MHKNLAALLLAAALSVAAAANAQDKSGEMTDMPALRAAVRADKHALVESALQLTPAEAKKFWPIYDAYQRVLDMTNRQRNIALEDLIALNKPLTDLYAKNLVAELIAADETELKARRTMQNKVLKALPAKKAARYLQIETKIRDVAAFDVAAGIPLIK